MLSGLQYLCYEWRSSAGHKGRGFRQAVAGVLVLVLGAAAAAPKRWAPNAKRYALHARARRNNCALVRCSDADGEL